MKKFKLLLIMAFAITIIVATGCDSLPPTKLEKPFIVVDKVPSSMNNPEETWRYTYQGSTGNERTFIERANAYRIGDTIK